MDNHDEKRPVLKSAEELRGAKATGAGKKGMNRWLGLLLVLVIAGGALLVYNFTDVLRPAAEPQATPAPSTAVKLIDKNPADFDRATIEKAGSAAYTVVSNLSYDGEGKTLPMPEGEQDYSIEGMDYFRTSASGCTSLENQFSTLSATATVEEQPADLSIYGLDKPQLTVSVKFRDGTGNKLTFGNKTPMNNGYYAQFDAGSTVYTIGTAAFSAADKTLEQMHAVEMPKDVTLTSDAFKRLVIEQPGKDVIELARDDTPSALSMYSLRLVQPIQYDAQLDRASAIIEAVCAVTLSGYAGHAAAPGELEPYGLGTPRARIAFTDTDGKSIEMKIGNAKDETYTYITVDGTGDVYLADSSLLSFLPDATASRLVDQFANLVNIAKVDALTVSDGASSYVLSIEREPVAKEDGTEGTADTYKFGGEVTDEKQFKGLYQEIIGLQLDKMIPPGALAGDPVATVTYKLNTGDPDIVIEYLSYDNDYCAIRQNGRMLFLIKRDKVATMLQKCQEYKDGTFVRS